MALDRTVLRLQVIGWSQTITHGERWPQYQLSVGARISNSEELVLDADGHRRLRSMLVDLDLIRGQPEKLERGIGLLGYYPEEPPHEDIGRLDEFVGGWFWLPEALFDEVWALAREHRGGECAVELEIGPVEKGRLNTRWNIEKNNTVSIARAGVRFERNLQSPAHAASPQRPKKRSLFSWGG
jgi:hypothetical protein